MQRNAALTLPFAASDISPTKTTRALNSDTFSTEGHRHFNRFLHRSAKRNPTLKLERDILGDKLGLDLGFLHLLDIEENLFAG